MRLLAQQGLRLYSVKRDRDSGGQDVPGSDRKYGFGDVEPGDEGGPGMEWGGL